MTRLTVRNRSEPHSTECHSVLDVLNSSCNLKLAVVNIRIELKYAELNFN